MKAPNIESIGTPAKLNLGLEILGRRSDGFHEIRTIFQAVSVFDELTLTPDCRFRYVTDRRIDRDEDIARPILKRAATIQQWSGTLSLRKGIPIAAGLGGGSSDAALALRLAASGATVDIEAARKLGADVPFFLRGGAALGAGIGDLLTPISAPEYWFVVNVPPLDLPEKTKTLYTGLVEEDLTDGVRIDRLAAALSMSPAMEMPRELPNAFERQMLLFNEVQRAWLELQRLAGRVALSGAGPAVFTWHDDKVVAKRVGSLARSRLPGATFVCRALPPHRDHRAIERFSTLLARN